MRGSPTIQRALTHFSLLKDTINMKSKEITINKLIFMYPIIILILLFSLRPNFVIKTDYTSHKREICPRKLFLWFIIFQIPLIYTFLN